MKKLRVSPSIVAVSIASALASSMSLAAEQDANDKKDIEVIEVKGIKGSVVKAMDIKRSSSGVVDAISAEDLGKFPDTNLAESLQRITGVSIDRKNNEGNQVSVRGFGPSFNMVTLNGRQMPAASTQKQEGDGTEEQSRAFNFAEIASESVAGVEVYKTSKAFATTGGIGATVNINTAKPLSFEGTKIFASAKGIMDRSVEQGDDVTPEVSGLFSTKFADDRIGFLVSASHSERDSRQDFVATDGWLRGGTASMDTSAMANPNGPTWIPRNLVVDHSDHQRTRTNAQAVLQFAPTKDMVFTLDYITSDYEDKVERNQVGVWIEGRGDDLLSTIANQNGSLNQISITPDGPLNYGAVDWQGYSDLVLTENRSIGANFEWQLTSNLKLELDYHDSYSEAQPDGKSSDFLVILSGPLGTAVDINFGTGDTPTVTLDDSATGSIPYGNSTYADLGVTSYLDPRGVRPNIDLKRNMAARNDVEQMQLHGEYVFDSGIVNSFRFGASKTTYTMTSQWSFDLGVQAQPFCVADPNAWNPCSADLANYLTPENTQFPQVFPTMLTFDTKAVFNDHIADMNSVFDSVFTNEHIVEEETEAVYGQLDISTELSGMALDILAGVRYEKTDVTGTTFQNAPEAMIYVSPTEFRPRMTEQVIGYTLTNDYDMVLPSLDVSLEVTDDLVARFSYGKSLARPNLNALKPAVTIGDARPGGPYNASSGNPGLLPYESTNIDLALEYYYDEGSYAAINYFTKDVENYLVTDITKGTLPSAAGWDLTDPNPTDDPNFPPQTAGGPDDQVIVWDISTVNNGEDAKVDGWELAVQHLFGESGYGLQANATFVDGDVEYDSSSLNQVVTLTGLSDSANLVVFYEKDAWQVRMAYNWRDDFLLSANQLRQMNEPVFIEAYGQIDISASYDISENLSVFIEGINVSGEDSSARGRFEEQFLYYGKQEARYALGVRANF